MLSNEVVEAVKANMFNIYAVSHIDEGIEILTGIKAGNRLKSGGFSRGSIKDKVNRRLLELAKPLMQRKTDAKENSKRKRVKNRRIFKLQIKEPARRAGSFLS